MTVDNDFVESALDDRFEVAQERWGSDVTRIFWEAWKEVVLDGGELTGSVSSIVDNYVINSDCGPIDDYREEGETDEECTDRIDPLFLQKEDGVTYVFLG